MRLAVIANPISGRGRTPQQVERFVEEAVARGHDVDLLLTKSADDPARFAATLDDTVDMLVVAGGDGTLNEVINGLKDPSAVPIAALAGGTANLLVRELSIPRDSVALLGAVEAGNVRRLDLGVANGRRFLLVLSVGFDAMVIDEIHRRRGRRLGFRGYLIPVIRAAWQYRPPKLQITIDDQETIEAGWAVVSNVQTYAGLFRIADRAECDSGWLDVCLFPKAARRDFVRYAIAARQGRMSEIPGMWYCNARRIRIDADEPTMVEIDGERFGRTPVDISVEPARVAIIVP